MKKKRLQDENAQLKTRICNLEENMKEKSFKLDHVYEKYVRLERSNTELVQEANRKKEFNDSKSVVGGDEVKRLSSLMESEKKRMQDENAQLETRICNLEEELKTKSFKLDHVYEKSVRLERSNTELVQEANRIKEFNDSKSVVGGEEVMAYVTNRLENLEIEKKRLEDELKTMTLILNDTLKEESVKLDDKCSRLEEKSVSMERSNIEIVLEVDRIKESIASQLAVRGATHVISQVGFTAVLTNDIKLGTLQTIHYDKVITNIGNGYELIHGHFKAPINGLYIISATSCSSENERIWTEIVLNGIKQAAMYGNTYDMGSHSIVVSLKQNDQVWVRNFGSVTTVHARKDRYYSSFSGVLIAAS